MIGVFWGYIGVPSFGKLANLLQWKDVHLFALLGPQGAKVHLLKLWQLGCEILHLSSILYGDTMVSNIE